VAKTELARVRAAAVAWRNGLGALLAGLIGFSLIKGRSDVSELETKAAVLVGLLLLCALIVGAFGGLVLLRAAYGRPTVSRIDQLPPASVADHREALESTRRLQRGIGATLACAALLISAVALTWYGPPNSGSELQFERMNGPSVCGTVVRVAGGNVVMKTSAGERTLPWSSVVGMKPVSSCGS
jgi:hypothetical protein